jgi:hypothetical protein
MAAATISFADELKPSKSHDDTFGVGGVYNLRSRRTSKSSLRDKIAFLSDDKAVPPEDEDSGLRNEGDYKSKQVRYNHQCSLVFCSNIKSNERCRSSLRASY